MSVDWFCWGGWVTWSYTLAMIIAEIVIGAQAAHISLAGSPEECAHLTEDTKNLAITFLIISWFCFLWCFLSFVWWLIRDHTLGDNQPCIPFCESELPCLDSGPLGSSLLSTLISIIMGSYISWKLHWTTFPPECDEIWTLFSACEILLIVTAPAAAIWLALAIRCNLECIRGGPQ